MNETKYNGYSNRSTWLAMLHLDNTNLDVYNQAQEIGKKYREAMKYWEDIQKRDPSSYSYPFHQVAGCERLLIDLLLKTEIRKEQDFGMSNINKHEVLQALADNNN